MIQKSTKIYTFFQFTNTFITQLNVKTFISGFRISTVSATAFKSRSNKVVNNNNNNE